MQSFRRTMIIWFLVLAVWYACGPSCFINFKFLTILSRSNIKEAGDQVTIFNSEYIETNPLVSLDHEALFFMAILCGGDYDKVSLIPTVFSCFLYLISSTWGWTKRLWMENCSFTCSEWSGEVFIFSCINVLISSRAAEFSSWLSWRTSLILSHRLM